MLRYQPPEEFQVFIPPDDAKLMFNFEDGCFRKGVWPIIVNKSLQKEHKACSFNATRGIALLKKKNSPYAKLYGKCNCNIQFTIEIWRKPESGESIQCKVKTRGTFNLIQAKSTSRQIRNVDRQVMASQLLHRKPGKVYLQNIHKTSIVRLLHQNNLQASLFTLQRIRHEALNATANHQDPFQDLLDFAKHTEENGKEGAKIKGFVHMRGFDAQNIQLHLYTEASLQMLHTIKKSGTPILHFDSTGSVTQSINSKRLLFYLGVVASSDGHTFPLAATLSYRGRSFEVSDLFRKINADMHTLHSDFKCLVPIVVCDFSFALITGLLSGVNTMEIMDYITASFQTITNKKQFSERKSLIFICTSHIIKSFTRLLGKHLPSTGESKKIKRLAGHAFARLQQTTDLHSYVSAIKLVCETFGTEYLSREKIAENRELIECKDYHESNNEEPDEEFEDLDSFRDDEPTRTKSPFSKIFRQVREKIETENNFDLDNYRNPYFFPKILDLISDYYAPYAPLWTSMLLFKTGRHTHGSITNGVVEHEFSFLKNNFHDEGACKVNIFVRRQYEYFSGKVLSQLSIPATRNKRPYKRKVQLQSAAAEKTKTSTEKTYTSNTNTTTLTEKTCSAAESITEDNQESHENQVAEEIWIKRPKKDLPLYISHQSLPKNQQQGLESAYMEEDISATIEKIYNDLLVIDNAAITEAGTLH